MSRVRYAVRRNGLHGPVTHPYSTKKSAAVSALTQGGKVVRVTQYDAAETAARRAVIEAAKAFRCWRIERGGDVGLGKELNDMFNAVRAAFDALDMAERKAGR